MIMWVVKRIWYTGDISNTSPGFQAYDIMVGCKTELLLLMGSSCTAVHSALSVDRSVWVTAGGSVTLDRGTSNL